MMTQEEWDQMKESERYGMIADLFKKIARVEQRISDLEIKTGNY